MAEGKPDVAQSYIKGLGTANIQINKVEVKVNLQLYFTSPINLKTFRGSDLFGLLQGDHKKSKK